MKIALIKLGATYSDWYKRPLLGIGYICSYLESKGYECRIFDASFHSWSEAQLLTQIRNFQPDVAGFTAMTHEIIPAARLAGLIKQELDIATVVGGPHVTALPQRTLEEFSEFDYVIFGEGEYSFLELLQCLQGQGGALKTIRGLAYREVSGQINVNEPRPPLTGDDLDNLPYPAFHQYYPQNGQALKSPDARYVILSSRGCPYHCAFCMQVLGRKVRHRSPVGLLQEIEYAMSAYGTHTIDFMDEIFLYDNDQTRRLLEMIIQRELPRRLSWWGLVRVNIVTSELISLAKKSGCVHLEMGVESGDDEILKRIHKGITVQQARDAVRIIKRAGIATKAYFILGHPGETRRTMKKTIDLAVELNTDEIAVGLMVPYPGTQIYDMALQGEGGYRLLTQDWSQYDKYFAHALEINDLPYCEIRKYQKRALINLYLKNFRILDAMAYFWYRRHMFRFLAKKLLASGSKRE